MPKKYSTEVRLFAVQRRQEGIPWDRITEMIKEHFHLESAPSRRQMTKWVAKGGVSGVILERVEQGLPEFVTEMLARRKGALSAMVAETLAGKDFRVLLAKWMLSEMQASFGAKQLDKAWSELQGEAGHPEKRGEAIVSRTKTSEVTPPEGSVDRS